MFGIYQEQVQRILSLIETPKFSFEMLLGKRRWLLDSGASYHTIGNIRLLFNMSNLPPIPIKLPTGVEVMDLKHGMPLSSKVILGDVVFVPGMTCNLVSIVQLIREIFYMATFTYKLCAIQGRIVRNFIGMGEQQQGVYLFKNIY